MSNLELRDIKTIVEIPDNSMIYLGVVIAVAIILIILIFIWLKKRKKIDKNLQNAKIILQNQNYKNSKTIAYNFEFYASLLVNEENQQEFLTIKNSLEQYKYKKAVNDLEPNLIVKIKEFVNV